MLAQYFLVPLLWWDISISILFQRMIWILFLKIEWIWTMAATRIILLFLVYHLGKTIIIFRIVVVFIAFYINVKHPTTLMRTSSCCSLSSQKKRKELLEIRWWQNDHNFKIFLDFQFVWKMCRKTQKTFKKPNIWETKRSANDKLTWEIFDFQFLFAKTQNTQKGPKRWMTNKQKAIQFVIGGELLVICVGHTAWAPKGCDKDEVKRPTGLQLEQLRGPQTSSAV